MIANRPFVTQSPFYYAIALKVRLTKKRDNSYKTYGRFYERWVRDETYPGPAINLHEKPTEKGWNDLLPAALRNRFIPARDEVRVYRNLICHRPLFLRVIVQGQTYLPKREHIRQYIEWVPRLFVEGILEKQQDHFALAAQVMGDQLQELTRSLNEIWTVVTEKLLSSLRDDPAFSRFREESEGAAKNHWTFPSPSASPSVAIVGAGPSPAASGQMEYLPPDALAPANESPYFSSASYAFTGIGPPPQMTERKKGRKGDDGENE
jgi:hypothetical protein